jgi:hypothetical protein
LHAKLVDPGKADDAHIDENPKRTVSKKDFVVDLRVNSEED